MCNIIHIYTVMGWVIGYTLQQYNAREPNRAHSQYNQHLSTAERSYSRDVPL